MLRVGMERIESRNRLFGGWKPRATRERSGRMKHLGKLSEYRVAELQRLAILSSDHRERAARGSAQCWRFLFAR